MIVLIEGGEGAGKTTVAKRLEAEHGFKFVKFPTPGSYLESVIFNKEAPIKEKAVAATLDFCNVLREEMKSGRDLVLDRGHWSTISYQGPEEFVDAINACGAEWTIEAIDHIILMDVDVNIGLAREEGHNVVSDSGLEFHTRCNKRMRYTYHFIKELQTGGTDVSLLPPKYPGVGEPTINDWYRMSMMPWTKEVHKFDTVVLNEKTSYVAVLGKLGLGGAAG